MEHFPWIYLVLIPIAIAWALRASRDPQKKPRKTVQPPPFSPQPPRNKAAPIRPLNLVDLSTPASWLSTPPPTAPVVPPFAPRVPTARAAPVKAKPPIDLDPGQFAPASDEQTKAAASSAGNLMGNPWFGRRDQIPPASDPRTILIDRAMVGQGLLTPEDLVEIHKVGDEMSSLRPELTGAAAIADRAVTEDREERKRIKEQKKAEAAERKRLHAEAVLHRRQTDIIFLGRGVSKGLADRRANVEKLAAAGLPVLAAPADVATALGLTIPRLRWLAFHSDASSITHYVRFTVPKKSGGTRTLFAPHKNLATAQEWILENILSKLPTHPCAHGFVPGRSTVTNAAGHVSRDVVVNADLTDFFPTITFFRVRGLFEQVGYSPAAATILALLCTECPRRVVTYAGKPFHVATGVRGLPQGACSSPALSNLISRRLDSRLAGIAAKLGWTYSRYADDLTFSADGEPTGKIGYLLARIRHITQDEGFSVNEKKTRILRQSAAQNVTGIIVNDRPGVPREVVRRLRAILHRAKSEGLAAQNRKQHPHFEMWVRGMIAYIGMVNPKQAEPLRAALELIVAG
jgi:retron-type reverse transcriptase